MGANARERSRSPQRMRSNVPKRGIDTDEEATMQGLIRSIVSGDCVVFIGAGFSAAARLPGWKELLTKIVDLGEAHGKLLEGEAQLLRDRLAANATSSVLDRCAQTLEDKMGHALFADAVAEILNQDDKKIPEQMKRRLALLHGIPFSAILTTNFDSFISGVPAASSDAPAVMRTILRARHASMTPRMILRHPELKRVADEVLSKHEKAHEERHMVMDMSSLAIGKDHGMESDVPVMKVHGCLSRKYRTEPGLAFTRMGYRRLLHGNGSYRQFLSAVMACKTVLYIGFSFSDEYINEIRSATMSMIGSDRESPIAYAIVNDKDDAEKEFFLRHEGVQMLNYHTPPENHSGFDELLQHIHDSTNPLRRWASGVQRKHILWVVARQLAEQVQTIVKVIETETNRLGEGSGEDTTTRFSLIIDGPDGGRPEKAIKAIEEAKEKEEPYDLIITANFHMCKGAEKILQYVLSLEEKYRCPTIAGICLPNPYSEETKRRLLSLGARSYVASVPTLLEEMYSVLAPAGETF